MRRGLRRRQAVAFYTAKWSGIVANQGRMTPSQSWNMRVEAAAASNEANESVLTGEISTLTAASPAPPGCATHSESGVEHHHETTIRESTEDVVQK
jgi:hypothetical protein